MTGKTSENGTTDEIELELKVEDAEFEPYHKGRPSRSDAIPPERREFIAWDGEGISHEGESKPQSYVLFGCSTGDRLVSPTHLHTFDILDFIVAVGKANPGAYHVGFAFNYDSNMIIRSLSEPALRAIHESGRLTLKKRNGEKYHIQFLSGKWFSVTKYGERYDRKTNPHDKTTVKIYDIFSFFGCSFIKAYENFCGSVPDIVTVGKSRRSVFSDIDEIERYWRVEIDMLRELSEELRKRLYGAGLRITQWHGPGALASYTLRKNGVRQHMAITPEHVREAARYAYAGGRFEMFKLGRVNGPIYSLDINSAYPYGITQLPSLASGNWYRADIRTKRIARFGIYRVRLHPTMADSYVARVVGPLFHRDSMGNISFPWITEGWYWSPEVLNITRHLPRERYEIVEGWEYLGDNIELPFTWVKEMYEKRMEWKQKGLSSQLALKLCMNSLYGKMAQRVGWDKDKRTAPPWHQLEWAGWVTANTRSMLYGVMCRIPYDKLIAAETDGIYTTMRPELLGITSTDGLGGWGIDVYDEILYVQSGLAWLRRGSEWICKRRGLDARTFDLDACRNYLHSLHPNELWNAYTGTTTRFIGIGAALNSKAPTKVRHCCWQTVDREIRPGQGGKRVHLFKQCHACSKGLTAYDAPHDMSIRSLAYKNPYSYPHDIPWEGEPQEHTWRDMQFEESGYVHTSNA